MYRSLMEAVVVVVEEDKMVEDQLVMAEVRANVFVDPSPHGNISTLKTATRPSTSKDNSGSSAKNAFAALHTKRKVYTTSLTQLLVDTSLVMPPPPKLATDAAPAANLSTVVTDVVDPPVAPTILDPIQPVLVNNNDAL
jgi:hypothetical protein